MAVPPRSTPATAFTGILRFGRKFSKCKLSKHASRTQPGADAGDFAMGFGQPGTVWLPQQPWIEGMPADTHHAHMCTLGVLRVEQKIPSRRHAHRGDPEQRGASGAKPFVTG